MNNTCENTQPIQVECRATKDTAVRLFIIAAMLIGMGVYCFIDAYVRDKYPPPEAWDMEHINEAAGYALNHFGPYLFLPVGLILIVFAIRSVTRRLIADEDGIGYAGKARIPWSQITSLDASVLQSKQILYVRHGRDKKLTLDGYKLSGFRDLVAFAEARVPEAAKREAPAAGPKQDQ